MPKATAHAVTELAKRLENDYWLDRRVAAQSLTRFAHKEEFGEIVPVIGDRLDEMNRRVRIAAATTLGDVSKADVAGTPSAAACRAVPELFKRLADPDIRVRHDVKQPLKKLRETGAIGNWGASIVEPAVPDLLRRLESDDWRQREPAAKALGNLGGVALPAAAELVKLHGDEGLRVRNAAKAALDKLNVDIAMVGAPAASTLVERLRVAEDWRSAAGAAWALGQAGQSFVAALGALSELLSNADAAVRFLTARALGDLGLASMPIFPRLADLVDDIDERVRLTARASSDRLAKLLERSCPPLEPEARRLIQRLENEEKPEPALGALAELGLASAGALPRIMRYLNHKLATVRTAAVVAVHKLGEAGAFGSLAHPVEIEVPPPIIDMLLATLEEGGGGLAWNDCEVGQKVSYLSEIRGRWMDATVVKMDAEGGAGVTVNVGGVERPVPIGKMSLQLKDEDWAVRLASAEALCSLCIAAASVWQKIQKAAEGKEDPKDHRLKQGGMQVISRLRKAGALIERFPAVLEAAVPELYDAVEDEDHQVQAIAFGMIRRLEVAGLLENDEKEESVVESVVSGLSEVSGVPVKEVEDEHKLPEIVVLPPPEEMPTEKDEESSSAIGPLEGRWWIGDSDFQLSAVENGVRFLQCLEDGTNVEGLLSLDGSDFKGSLTREGDDAGCLRVRYHDGQRQLLLVNFQEPGTEEWWDTIVAHKETMALLDSDRATPHAAPEDLPLAVAGDAE